MGTETFPAQETGWCGKDLGAPGERDPGWGLRPSCCHPACSSQGGYCSTGTGLLPAPPPALLASFLPGVAGTTAPEEALNVAQQAGRPEGGGREAWAGIPAPTWTPVGPGPCH